MNWQGSFVRLFSIRRTSFHVNVPRFLDFYNDLLIQDSLLFNCPPLSHTHPRTRISPRLIQFCREDRESGFLTVCPQKAPAERLNSVPHVFQRFDWHCRGLGKCVLQIRTFRLQTSGLILLFFCDLWKLPKDENLSTRTLSVSSRQLGGWVIFCSWILNPDTRDDFFLPGKEGERKNPGTKNDMHVSTKKKNWRQKIKRTGGTLGPFRIFVLDSSTRCEWANEGNKEHLWFIPLNPSASPHYTFLNGFFLPQAFFSILIKIRHRKYKWRKGAFSFEHNEWQEPGTVPARSRHHVHNFLGYPLIPVKNRTESHFSLLAVFPVFFMPARMFFFIILVRFLRLLSVF